MNEYILPESDIQSKSEMELIELINTNQMLPNNSKAIWLLKNNHKDSRAAFFVGFKEDENIVVFTYLSGEHDGEAFNCFCEPTRMCKNIIMSELIKKTI